MWLRPGATTEGASDVSLSHLFHLLPRPCRCSFCVLFFVVCFFLLFCFWFVLCFASAVGCFDL